MGKRRFAFYTRWNDKDEMICGCLFCNPCCDKWKDNGCEEIELTLNPFDDIETVMKEARRYGRSKGGAMRQK